MRESHRIVTHRIRETGRGLRTPAYPDHPADVLISCILSTSNCATLDTVHLGSIMHFIQCATSLSHKKAISHQLCLGNICLPVGPHCPRYPVEFVLTQRKHPVEFVLTQRERPLFEVTLSRWRHRCGLVLTLSSVWKRATTTPLASFGGGCKHNREFVIYGAKETEMCCNLSCTTNRVQTESLSCL